mmetsp:Transcript_128819/g.222572  ORF Transcript_128819/g.222572 Transcript_128819/m.222572 type:complete len:200 (-) Transcript_128819:1402-2001(-)
MLWHVVLVVVVIAPADLVGLAPFAFGFGNWAAFGLLVLPFSTGRWMASHVDATVLGLCLLRTRWFVLVGPSCPPPLPPSTTILMLVVGFRVPLAPVPFPRTATVFQLCVIAVVVVLPRTASLATPSLLLLPRPPLAVLPAIVIIRARHVGPPALRRVVVIVIIGPRLLVCSATFGAPPPIWSPTLRCLLTPLFLCVSCA